MADPGYLSNAELANEVVALVQKYNIFTGEQVEFFTTDQPTVSITVADGSTITVPSLHAILTGSGSGGIAIFESIAEGIAAVGDGQLFFVTLDSGSYLGLYRKSGLLGKEVGRYPSRDAIDGTAVHADIGSAVGHADAVMLTPFNEFDLDTVPQVDTAGRGFNTVMDEIINNVTLANAKANFHFTVRDDLARLTGVRTVCVWTQWFSVCSSLDGANPGIVQPAINADIASKLSSPTQWSVSGVVAAGALQLQGSAGGTQDDVAQVRGMKHLLDRGYEVGFVPIVLGRVSGSGLAESQSLVWRGFFHWASTALFSAWLDSYKAMHAHYIALFLANGITPAWWYLASEFSAIEKSAPDAQWAMWVAACAQIAADVRAAFPECRIAYAANYTEYGVGTDFRVDAIWTQPNIDEVGIEWYFRLTSGVTGSAESVVAGLAAGEDMDYTYSTSDGNQRKLSRSSGQGKAHETRTPIDASAGIKNTVGFWQGAHYVPKQAGFIAQASPQPGYGRGYDPYGLPGMTGNAVVAVAPGVTYPGTSGAHYPPIGSSTYLLCDGTATAGYGQFKTPTFSGGTQTEWRLEFDFQVTATPAGNYARVLRLGGAVEIMADGSTLKLGVGPDGNQYFADLGALNTSAHTLVASLNIGTGLLTIVYDGVSAQHSIPAAQRPAIPSNADFVIGGYNPNSNLMPLRAHRLQLTFVRDGVRWGGTFHFDDTYAGVRTAWVPKMKKISATELGYASIGGTCVEPSQFVYADLGSSAMPLPAILDSTTRAIYQSFIAKGWKPAEVYASYGSNFNYAPFEQFYALRETLRYMQALQHRGMLKSICLYNLDARPAAAMAATLGGVLYYSDAPMSVFGHSLNGKLAGGSTLYHNRILQKGSIL
ncbi:baseplate megatron protein TIM-barrel domain-containing protein [Xanthomonas euvesicatoria]|uniref:baseplate megatron protein TIM-barrel domain-containing protein n=1 Tax=Xanthomonas euvesicatoria TaxID=456327 RepID=UPI003A102AEB